MLSDLIRHFTNYTENNVDFIEDDEIITFLKFVYRYTKNQKIKNNIREAVIERQEEINDISFLFASVYYDNTIHLDDLFGCSFLELLFSTLDKNINIDLNFTMIDDLLTPMHKTNQGDYIYKIKDYKKIELNKKIDSWLNKNILNFLYAISGGEEIDDYDASVHEIHIAIVSFKNKSIGRKVRKYYLNNFYIHDAFDELGIEMINGVFVVTGAHNIEIDYDEQLDIYRIIKGFLELKRLLADKEDNKIDTKLQRKFKQLNDLLLEERSSYYLSRVPFVSLIIRSIENTIYPPKKEVIL